MSLLLFLLAILGLLSLTKLTLSILYYAYAFFLRPAKPLKTRYGPWAVVTGSTDGIGKGIAFELARNSLNLVLVGRSPAKLDSVTASIKRKHPETEIKPVVFDLAGDLRTGLQTLNEAIRDVDVGVLVNNAGVAHQNSFYFHEDEMELYMEMVKVNLVALTEITRAVLRGMLERKRGAVVNIGSGGAAVIPSYPLFSVYAATKAYRRGSLGLIAAVPVSFQSFPLCGSCLLLDRHFNQPLGTVWSSCNFICNQAVNQQL